jgi:hypothetical protein
MLLEAGAAEPAAGAAGGADWVADVTAGSLTGAGWPPTAGGGAPAVVAGTSEGVPWATVETGHSSAAAVSAAANNIPAEGRSDIIP